MKKFYQEPEFEISVIADIITDESDELETPLSGSSDEELG